MAPSSGHLLVPKAWRAMRYAALSRTVYCRLIRIRFAFEKASRLIRDKIPQAARPVQAELEPVLVRNTPRQPIPRAALLRQTQSRWFSSQPAFNPTVRGFSSKAGGKGVRSAFPASRTGSAVSSLTSRAPFASTLRPNLTGGTLGRTAGGYGTGAGRVGGTRYFSHAPASQAQVVNTVSAGLQGRERSPRESWTHPEICPASCTWLVYRFSYLPDRHCVGTSQ